MTHTEQFEHLLDKENVRAVEWDGGKVIIRVSKKIPEEELADDDIVNLQVEQEVNVIDEGDERGKGYYELFEYRDTSTSPESRHRPIPAGVSEGHEDITAGTGSIYPAKVVSPDNGNWREDVSRGDLVRLSNNHIYANVNKGEYGDNILQPGVYDGGTTADAVGLLAGYVPIQDGVTVDVAARTTDPDRDIEEIHNLEGYNTGVYRGNYSQLKGVVATKSGRTTGVTTGEIEDTSASVNVRIGNDTVVFRDMIISENMGDAGDSGSPAFIRETGELFGLLFAGSRMATIFCKAKNIESELGVEIQSRETEPEPPKEDDKSIIEIIMDLIRSILDLISKIRQLASSK